MKIFKLIVLLLLTKCQSYSCNTLIEKSALVANSVFKDLSTSVLWCRDVRDDVTDFIKLFHGSVYVATVENNTLNDENIQKMYKNKILQNTVFFAAEIEEIKYFLSLLGQVLVTPIRLIIVPINPVKSGDLTKFMEIAWKNDFANILVVNSNKQNVLLSTFFPYRNSKCGDITPVFLDWETKELFPRKFKNFYHCEIRTTLLEMAPYSFLKFENQTVVSVSGIDGNVLNVLFEILNASMKVISAKDHGGTGTMVNGTATGCFADLVEKRADLMIPGLIMNIIRYPYVQFGHPHEVINIVWFGPQRRKLSDWLRLLQPFLSQITPAVFITALVFIVATILVRKFGHRAHSRRSVFFQSFAIFLGIEAKFETASQLANYLFMLWIWFCMVVRIAVQGDLVNILQVTAYESPLETFVTAVEQVDGYGGIDNLRFYFNGTKYYDKYEVIPFKNLTHYLKDINEGKRYLLATDKELGLHSAPKSQVLNNDPVVRGPGVSITMRPGWPAAPEINNLIKRIIETGFVAEIYRKHSWEFEKKMEKVENRDAKPLTLQSLIGYFYALGVMYGVCILVLFSELAYSKLKLNQRSYC